MKKMPEISPRDLEMLSAYLDGQLSSKEIARLQKRLQSDLQLQIALDELRLTRTALRSLPMLRAPRNFTLKPDMVRQRGSARRPAYPIFGFASLVATLLLVIVFVTDRVSFLSTAQTAQLQSAAQATQMEELVETMVVESLATEGIAASQAEDLQLKEAPAAAGESAASGLAEEATPEEGALELFAAPAAEGTEAADLQMPAESSPMLTPTTSPTPFPTFTPTPTLTPWLINGTEVIGVGGGAPDTPRDMHTSTPEPSETPSPTPTPSPTFTSTPTDTPVPTDTPLPSDTAAPAGEALPMQLPSGEAPVLEADDVAPEEQARQMTPGVEQDRSSRPIFLAVEILLGLLALVSAAVFIYLYRKAR